MSAELLATYAGLGTQDGQQYYRGEECLACVKDLIRALRNDDSRCEIRRQLGQAGILQKDLIPILIGCGDSPILRNDIIRLLVNLTQPAYLCFGGTFPKGKDADMMKCFMEVNRYLRQYKEAFTEENVMYVLGSVLAELCQKSWDDRDDDDIIVIERILLLIRNLLHVTADSQEEKRTSDDVSIHDQIIWNLHVNGMDELLLFLGSNPDESQWCMHVLEITFLMLKEQSAETLARTGSGRTAAEKKKDEDMIEEALAKERARRLKAQRSRGTRHSSFGGTFVVKNQKSISGKERVYHRPLAGLNDHSYDVEKRPRRTAKPRRPANDPPKERMSTYSVGVVLKDWAIQFLECCYNILMKVVRDNIMHQRAMDNDETYYLWAMKFFMEFSRHHQFRVDIVGETLQLQTLHYIIQLIANYYETMIMEKRSLADARQWGQRLHYAIQAYKELLLYVQQMSLSKDPTLCDSAKVIHSNIFYHPEYRDVFVTLLRNFYEVFQTRACLRDIVEATHVYFRQMERYSTENSHMIVQERRTGKGHGKKKKGGQKGRSSKVLSESQLVDLWETIDARVGELLEGCEPLPPPPVTFNPASDVPIEEQKIDAMGRIRMLLIDAEHAEAISLYRAAREVWPGAEFGSSGMSVDEEMDGVRDILLNPAAALPADRLLGAWPGGGESGDEDDYNEEGGDAGEGSKVTTVELEFNLKKYIERFSNNKIVRSYCLVLADYSNNSEIVNHAVVKMLYRIAVQLKMPPLLYQISVFRTLLAILQEPPTNRYKELQKFSRYVVRGFFEMAKKNPLMYVEVLFWKTSRDCYELTEGYGTLEREKELRLMGTVWTREQEEELAELFQRYKGDQDIVGCIMAALEGGEVKRSRKQITNQLIRQELVEDRKSLHKKPTKKKKGEWSEEELTTLREAFQSQDDWREAVREVSVYFPERGIRDLTQQLRTLGLIPSKNKKCGSQSGTMGSDSDSCGESCDQQKTYKSRSVIDSDSESDSDSPTNKNPPRSREAKNKGKVNRRSVPSIVARLHRDGYSEQLAWLEAYLRDEASDRSMDDEWEEMCIVAVTENVTMALSSEPFQQLLGAIGLQPPNDQEVYWRIPASMTPDQLNTAATSLTPPTGGVASTEPGNDTDDSRENEKGGGASAKSGHMSNGQSHMTMSSSGEDDGSSDDGERELTKAEALAVLRRSKGKTDKQDQLTKSTTTADKENGAIEEDTCSPGSRPRLTRSGSFFESDSDMEREGDHNSPAKMKDGPAEKQLKRVRKLDDDSDSGNEHDGVPFPFQDSAGDQQAKDRDQSSLRQPAPKKMRKWVDSDSDSESSSSCSDEDDTVNTSRHKREEDTVNSSRHEREEGYTRQGGASKEMERGVKESDSEGEGDLEIDLDHQSQEGSGGEEEEGIRSPVCDTVELLHSDAVGGEGSEMNGGTLAIECGSLATLAML